MPELPEVEAERRLMETHLVGKRVATVVAREQGGGPRNGLFDDKVIGEGVTPERFVAALTGVTVLSAKRKGKQLYLELDSARHLLIHNGMTGALLVRGRRAPAYKNAKFDEQWPPRFCKFELKTQDGTDVAFVDSRRFGRAYLRGADAEAVSPLADLAVDPFVSELDLPTMVAGFAARSAPIKAVLLDQRAVVCGVGNWIADEVLYQSRVLPSTPANALAPEAVADLRGALKEVLRVACDADAEATQFPRTWLFHYRWAKQTSGSIASPLGRIHFATVGGRTTAFVPAKQTKRSSGGTPAKTGGNATPTKKRRPAVSSSSSSSDGGGGADDGGNVTSSPPAAPDATAESPPTAKKRRSARLVPSSSSSLSYPS
mmetsp:Transcript_29869/g.91461  ORF Transcript_29869/g.91461 Transcript_29869/m.91461 type:complete len:373 (+) Transcript_29869:101-1219(+)